MRVSGLLLVATLGCGRTLIYDCHVSVSPTNLDLGAVAPGTSNWGIVAVTDTGNDACAIAGISLAAGSDPGFELQSPSSMTAAPETSALLTVAFAPPNDDPPYVRTATLVFQTSAFDAPAFAIPVRATLPKCTLSVSPPSLDLGLVQPGVQATGMVSLESTGQAPCTVDDFALASSSNPGFTLLSSTGPLTLAPGESATVGVGFETAVNTAPLTRTGALTFATGDPANPTAEVGLTVELAPCELSIAPSSLSLGLVVVGGMASGEVTLSNTGTGSCAISGVEVGLDPDFALSAGVATSFELVPEGTASIAIDFSDFDGAALPLTHSATLSLRAAGMGTQSVPVTAQIDVGCSDQTREGFTDVASFPTLAACSGGWSIAGMPSPASCGLTGGNDGPNPDGTGCAAADLCSANFHICTSSGDVARGLGTQSCDAVTSTAGLFFATLQTGPGCGDCSGADGTACLLLDCVGASASIPNLCENDLFGCGTVGDLPQQTGTDGCAPLTASGSNLCSALPSPWYCGTDTFREFLNVVKPSPEVGGVLCCQK